MQSDITSGQKSIEVLRSLDRKVEPSWTALLLIDLLNDFLAPDGKTAADAGRPIDFARAVIPAQQRLLAAARAAGVMVIHVAQTTLHNRASSSGPWLDARSRATYSVEDLCMEGSWGGRVIDELAPLDDELVIPKYRYSGFAGTNLDLVLRSRGIRTTICAGVSTNVCVEATAREAFSHDYYVVLPEDACASWDEPLHHATLATAGHRYASVTTVDELAAQWRPTDPAADDPTTDDPTTDDAGAR